MIEDGVDVLQMNSPSMDILFKSFGIRSVEVTTSSSQEKSCSMESGVGSQGSSYKRIMRIETHI